MRYLLLLSGGFDSTLLLLKLVRQGHQITPLYIKVGSNSIKAERELVALNSILEKVRAEYPAAKVGELLTCTTDLKGASPAWVQPMLWVTAAVGFTNTKKYDKVAVAYILGDDVSRAMAEIKSLWSTSLAMECMPEGGEFSGEAKTPVEFVTPLFDGMYRKVDVIAELIQDYPKYYELATCCEASVDKDAYCDCIPCRTHREAVTILEVRKAIAHRGGERLEECILSFDIDGVLNSTESAERLKQMLEIHEGDIVVNGVPESIYTDLGLTRHENGGDYVDNKLVHKLFDAYWIARRIYKTVKMMPTCALAMVVSEENIRNYLNRALNGCQGEIFDKHFQFPEGSFIKNKWYCGGGERRFYDLRHLEAELPGVDIIHIDDQQSEDNSYSKLFIKVSSARGIDESTLQLLKNRLVSNQRKLIRMI